MAQHNQISATLSPKDMEEVMNAIGVIQRKLPFLINMTFDERRTHLKMGDHRAAMPLFKQALAIRKDVLGDKAETVGTLVIR